MRTDVAIVGAGIGGAALALALGRRGWRVALVEREETSPRLARPEILWSPTPRALEPLGVADAIRDVASVALDGVEIGRANGVLALSGSDFAAAGITPYSTDPSHTRAILVGAAEATGNVEVHRGVAVEGVKRDGERVVGIRGTRRGGTFELEASLVCGDDGGGSVVRKTAGLGDIETTMFPVDFITALIRLPAGMDPRRVRVFIEPRNLRRGLPAVALFPWPGGQGVLLMPLPHGRTETFFAGPAEELWSGLRALTPFAPELESQLRFPGSFARTRLAFGHARSYVVDGAAIIGDAAHPMSPAGGQGANASIWDALALAPVADAALRAGDTRRERLLPYERRRYSANAKSVALSTLAARLFRAVSPLQVTWVVPLILRAFRASPALRRALLRRFAASFRTEG